VGKIDRRKTSLCWVHGSSELGAKAQYHRQAAGDDRAAAKQARGAAEHEQR
jgi:hypothetical protein